MAEVAMPVVTNANIKLRKKVLLIGLISFPPSDLGPAFQTLCHFNGRSLAGSCSGTARGGERLKMIRTADSP
jgi:hypothetical protein